MWRALKTWWRYLGTSLHLMHRKHADPEVQLEQAIEEARSQHKRLTEQAANVIANQQQVQRRLDRTIADFEKADASARQALLLADREERSGEGERQAGLLRAAESFADRSIALEQEIRDVEQQLLEATRAAQGAKAAVAANAEALRKHLSEQEQLRSTLDQAKLQERVNRSIEQINGSIGETVPTLEEVRRKIDARYDRARAYAALAEAQTPALDLAMLEVERAQRSLGAQARLAEMRQSLGLRQPAELVRQQPREQPR